MKARYAEKANYWETAVHPAKSQGEIMEMLDEFGATASALMQGQADGRYAWLIRFQWQGKSYRFTFVPLVCQYPNKISKFSGKARSHEDQAKYQMGRIAVYFVKAILTAAEAHPFALFGFMELPETARNGALPMVAGELDSDRITSALPDNLQHLLSSGE